MSSHQSPESSPGRGWVKDGLQQIEAPQLLGLPSLEEKPSLGSMAKGLFLHLTCYLAIPKP